MVHGSATLGGDPWFLVAEKCKFLARENTQCRQEQDRIGQAKLGLGISQAKLIIAQASSISTDVLLMTLKKLLDLQFVFFGVA